MANIEYTSKSLVPFEEKMKKTISVLKSDFQTIRAGRANPRVLDNVSVSYYGAETPLNQVANIQVPEARMLMITPWDKTLLKELERAVQASNIGINPMNDGQSLRLVFPPLTEERRQELTRDVSQMGEEAKVSVRNIRREAIDLYKKYLKDSDISENLYYTVEADIQKLTDRYVELVDLAVSEKNEELMEI
ncbi:MAG: ribosome recycling factor [Clostridiaceae bacterium]|jgi:ribosome recycling factor|nr:ribosome recycling factor [Clostridiaceae bacterium]